VPLLLFFDRRLKRLRRAKAAHRLRSAHGAVHRPNCLPREQPKARSVRVKQLLERAGEWLKDFPPGCTHTREPAQPLRCNHANLSSTPYICCVCLHVQRFRRHFAALDSSRGRLIGPRADLAPLPLPGRRIYAVRGSSGIGVASGVCRRSGVSDMLTEFWFLLEESTDYCVPMLTHCPSPQSDLISCRCHILTRRWNGTLRLAPLPVFQDMAAWWKTCLEPHITTVANVFLGSCRLGCFVDNKTIRR